jgi:hypothetical protein
MDVVASSGGLFSGQTPTNGGTELATQTPDPLTDEEWVHLTEEVGFSN